MSRPIADTIRQRGGDTEYPPGDRHRSGGGGGACMSSGDGFGELDDVWVSIDFGGIRALHAGALSLLGSPP